MSETAAAMALIRGRDPGFDMSRLLGGVRHDAPRVVKAFLTRDMAVLAQHMGPELLERLGGIFKHYEAEVGSGGGWVGWCVRQPCSALPPPPLCCPLSLCLSLCRPALPRLP